MSVTYFLKVKDLIRDHLSSLNVVISQTVQMGQILLLPTYGKSLIGFHMVYLYLTLTNSKGQDHVNID